MGATGLPANCQGQCSPEHTGVSAEEKKKSIPHWWPHSLYSHTYTLARVHRKFYARSRIPRLWHEYSHVGIRNEYAQLWCDACARLPGSEQSLPEGPRTQLRGWTRRRDSRGRMIINKQTNKQTDAPKQHGQNDIMTPHEPDKKGWQNPDLHRHLHGVPDCNHATVLKAGSLPQLLKL